MPHTNAPWLIALSPLDIDNNFKIASVQNNVSPNYFNYVIHAQYPTGPATDFPSWHGAANAALIAASPQMYEYIEKRARDGDLEAARILASIVYTESQLNSRPNAFDEAMKHD